MNTQGLTKEDLHQIWRYFRAKEWARLPILISKAIVPILLIFLPAIYIFIVLIIITSIWTFFICHRYINLGVANNAYFAIRRCKWFVAVPCSAYLIGIGEVSIGILAILWPLIASIVVWIFPEDVTSIEMVFLSQWSKYVK